MIEPVQLLRGLFDACVRHAQPASAIARHLPEPPVGRTVVIGAGKASASMALAFDAAWPSDRPLAGVVITRYGYVPEQARQGRGRIRIHEAAHPIPDGSGLVGVGLIRDVLAGLTEDDLVVALMSGGGSSLLPGPLTEHDLAEEQQLNDQLLKSGASIIEMNIVRRHASSLKGGRLAALCRPARVVTLALSDVPGDRIEDIASGPTVPDSSTCQDALDVIRRYGLELPEATMRGLKSGELETPKPGDSAFASDQAIVIATPATAIEAAASAARAQGLACHVLGDALEGEAHDSAIVHAGIARAVRCGASSMTPPCVILSGGEATVTLPRSNDFDGSGGRCSEFALAAALYLKGEPNIWLLAADTDGIDGRGAAAGAYVTPSTLVEAKSRGLDAAESLAAHDSGTFFQRLGAHVTCGPTYTNVNDFRAILVLPS